MIAYLRLLRVGTLFSPAADVIAGACLVGTPWSMELVRAAAASVLVYGAGMVLNDHADRREDARQRPERPIPSGAVSAATALALGFALLAAGIAISPFVAFWATLAILVLAYDYLLKRSPALGACTMGALRGMNLLAGAVVATSTLPEDRMVWIAAGVYAAYIVAVTVLGIFEDEPKVRPRAVVAVQTVPPLTAPLVLLGLERPWPAAALGFVLAVLFARRVRGRGQDWNQAAIRQSMTWLLLGTMCYTSLLCLGSGRWLESVGIAAAIPIARSISKRIALT
ncbi:MAG: UbiA family prenyltransferase [Planctomycetes bacterium]|nr:UbiA family prenyltransferase [Planctomycetota bacterium]